MNTPGQRAQTKKSNDVNFRRMINGWKKRRSKNEFKISRDQVADAVKMYLAGGGKISTCSITSEPVISGPANEADNFLMG